MRRAAVGIHDDLAPGQAAVAHRPTHHEASGRIDQITGVATQHIFRNYRFDDFFDHRFSQYSVRNVRMMLGGYHHSLYPLRPAVQVAHRHLRLGVGTQPRQAPVFSQFRLPLHQAVGIVNRHRHQLRRLVAGVAEHEPLIARPLIHFLFLGAVDPLGDVGRLLVESSQHCASSGIETNVGTGVTNALDGFARDHIVIHRSMGGDFT